MKVSKHFKRSEFECNCGLCGRNCVDVELLTVLEDLHFHLSERYLGQRIYIEIESGNRCPVHNARTPGASPRSQHLLGKAADIKAWTKWHADQVDPNILAGYLERSYPDQYGIGRYDHFTHIDVRLGPARWDFRTQKQ